MDETHAAHLLEKKREQVGKCFLIGRKMQMTSITSASLRGLTPERHTHEDRTKADLKGQSRPSQSYTDQHKRLCCDGKNEKSRKTSTKRQK